jgi:hypothetical protein
MPAGRAIGFALIGVLAGGALGGGAGVLSGLAYTSFAETSNFEGYSGYVVAFWMLAGIFLGVIAGIITGARLARR